MKLWIAKTGKTDQSWTTWSENILDWLPPKTVEKQFEYTSEHFCLSEFHYDVTQSYNTNKLNLPLPYLLEGWIKFGDEKIIYDKNSSTSIELHNKLINSLNSSDFHNTNGDFNVVLWNDKQKKLSLVNDIYSASSRVYYWEDKNGDLYVSNDLRVLFLCTIIPFNVNYEICKEHATYYYLATENDIKGKTFFENIYILPESSVLTWQNGDINISEYYGIDNFKKLDYYTSNAEKHFRNTLNGVMGDRLKAGPSLFQVSGGLDSATVLASAIDLKQGNEIAAVNLSFKDQEVRNLDDQNVVSKLYKDLGIRGYILFVDDALRIPNSELGRDRLHYIDGPDPRSNPILAESLSAFGSKLNKTNFFSGEAGDALFGGTRFIFDSMIRRKKFLEALKMTWRWSKGTENRRNIKGFWYRYRKYNIEPLIPYLNDRTYYKSLWEEENLRLPEYFTNEHKYRDLLSREKIQTNYIKSKKLKSFDRRFIYDFMWPRAKYLDGKLSYGIDSHPLQDKRMIELALRIPPEKQYDHIRGWGYEKFYNGQKMILRNSYRDILPEYITDRETKTEYAFMDRLTFRNEKKNLLNLFNVEKNVEIVNLGIVDYQKFRDNLIANIIKSEDPNCEFGPDYLYLRGMIDMEIWLREMRKGREYVLDRSRPQKPIFVGEVLNVN